MGDIIECIDVRLDRRVVIKKLKDGEEERRLIDEQHALIHLRSKHVVQLFDVVSVIDGGETSAGLVLEYIDGKNLDWGGFKPDPAFLKTLWQIACGLADIHSAGIIHRDIKPNNIRIDKECVIKIIDFGLSRRDGPEAKTKSVIGTLGFMAPELWRGRTISFDKSIDVYAFGVTALALLGLPLPTELQDRPPTQVPKGAITSLLASLPSEVAELIEKCVDYTPANRPKMAEIRDELARHLLFDKHRALLIIAGKPHEINKNNRTVSVRFGSDTSISITYDGYVYRVSQINGRVDANNRPLAVGSIMPGCAVLTLNSTAARAFVTFDVSTPEVMP